MISFPCELQACELAGGLERLACHWAYEHSAYNPAQAMVPVEGQCTVMLQPSSIQYVTLVRLILPPTTAPSSSSVKAMSPAGFSGSAARSASLRLLRYPSSFHALMISMRFPPSAWPHY